MILAYRAQRARTAGFRICSLGSALAFTCGLIALLWKVPAQASADLVIIFGCLSSLWLDRRQQRVAPEYVWWPAYVGFWLSSFPSLFYTGFATSPFFTEYMMLLFIGALVVQTRLTWKHALAFALANVALWIALGAAYRAEKPVPLPFGFMLARTLLLFLAVVVCIRSLLVTEEKLAGTACARSRDLAETQTKLSHTERLAEVGNLVAATTHEIAQPIQVISSSSALLSRLFCGEQRDEQRIAALVDNIAESSRRAIRLLNELKNFSRRVPFETAPLDLREAVRSVHLLTQFDLRSRRIAYEVRLPEEPIWIDGDSIRLQQILLNLVNNARDACECRELPEVELQAERIGPWARLIVRNNGPEIPLQIQNQLFNAYFTTKCRGRGTGLGLSICAQLAEQHGGRIFFASEPDQTVFVVDLPLLKRDELHQPQWAAR